MPWQGWPPAPARPIAGDGRPTNSLTISAKRHTAFVRDFRLQSLTVQIPGAKLNLSSVSVFSAVCSKGARMEWQNDEFDLGGVNHLALVCSDMKRTVEFYTQVLGMRLIKTIELPAGSGQHFFFAMGGANAR